MPVAVAAGVRALAVRRAFVCGISVCLLFVALATTILVLAACCAFVCASSLRVSTVAAVVATPRALSVPGAFFFFLRVSSLGV